MTPVTNFFKLTKKFIHFPGLLGKRYVKTGFMENAVFYMKNQVFVEFMTASSAGKVNTDISLLA
jgi:hypothetical protein